MFKNSNHFIFALVLIFLFTIVLVPGKTYASTSGLVIDEFKIAGDGNSYDEYVVIANYGLEAINLKGFSVSRKSQASSSPYNTLYKFSVNEDYYILQGERIVIGHAKSTDYDNLIKYYTTSYSMTADNSIAILKGDEEIDLVGYGELFGNISRFEAFPLPVINADEVYRRKNGVDTNNNLDDFEKVVQKALIDINADKILITEVLPNPEDGIEWFELYNPTNTLIGLFGLKICDGAGRTHCYSFGKNDFLAPFEYKTYEQSITKITLNNDGDWLELYGNEETAISSSTENFGESDKGNSFALFGSTWMWTSTPTKAVENVFTDIIEIEPVKAVKKSVKKTSTASKTATSTTKFSEEQADSQSFASNDTKVKGDVVSASDQAKKNKISQETVGYGIMGLAIAVLLGYTLWENKERLSEFVKRIRKRND